MNYYVVLVDERYIRNCVSLCPLYFLLSQNKTTIIMKKYIYLILLLILPNLSFSQVENENTGFAPVGAEWWHGNIISIYTDLLPFSINSKVIGDTLIQGRTAAIVEMT